MFETLAASDRSNVDVTLDIEHVMLAFNDQQRGVIRGVLNDEPMTEVAAALGITPSRVIRIRISTFDKLSADLESYRKS